MRKIIVMAVCGLGLALVAAPLAAQEESPRSGVWFTIGFGAGSVGVDCPDCGNLFPDRVSSLSGVLGIGWTVNSTLVLGLEGQGWVKNDDVLNRRLAALNLVALVYPSKSMGLYLKGGVGGVRVVVETPDLTNVAVGEGFGWTIGAGWDFYLSRSVALTPYVMYLGSSGTTTTLNGAGINVNLNPNMWQLGGALTIP